MRKKTLAMILFAVSLSPAVFAQPRPPRNGFSIDGICRRLFSVGAKQTPVQNEEIDWGVESLSNTDRQVYNAVLQGLLTRRSPDFSSVDRDAAYKAMQKAFNSTQYFAVLRNNLSEFSEGKLSLEDAEPAEFPGRVRGPYRYLKLISKSPFQADLLVGIGPYIDPVQVFGTRREFFSSWFETPKRGPGERRGFWDSWF